ncbi:MAG: precorrin-6x reductase [Bacillota bacterium]|nr:precorrin-6x reductase [Bacillota bacterium]
MNKVSICIFGGTTEGRQLAEFLSNNNIKADLYIATDYGQQFINNLKNINVFQNRLNQDEMVELFKIKNYDFIVDATHPFAKIVTENIIKASADCNKKYLRIIRNSNESNYCKYFDSVEECVKYLNNSKGNILLTTGSKDLDKFTEVKNYAENIFVRILPMINSLNRCIELGYLNKNVICMQGPISEELNIAMINAIKAKYVVTKESAASGGFDEKVNACIKTNTECLVIRKPEEKGMTVIEICEFLKR